MEQWTYVVPSVTKSEIVNHCINDENWQKFRRSLKGLPTTQKLIKLADWLVTAEDQLRPGAEVQVANYINALRRGGQLDLQNKVQR
jgi:uncharacterized protein (DUF934 family)